MPREICNAAHAIRSAYGKGGCVLTRRWLTGEPPFKMPWHASPRKRRRAAATNAAAAAPEPR